MTSKRGLNSAALSGWLLFLGVAVIAAVGFGRDFRDGTKARLTLAESEFQRDELRLAADQSSLRRSLLNNADDVRIARLRQRVRQDWLQLVTDRGHPQRDQAEQFRELAAGRRGGYGRRG